MAAFRSSPQFSGGLTKLCRRLNTPASGSCDLSWRRFYHFKLFPGVQVNQFRYLVARQGTPNNSELSKATEKQLCSQVSGLCSSHTFGSCRVGSVRFTKLCPVLNTHIPRITLTCNCKFLGHVRHYCTDEFKGHIETEDVMEGKGQSKSVETAEFKGHKDETREAMTIRGHSGDADADLLGISKVSKQPGVKTGHKPEISEDGSSETNIQLILNKQTFPQVKVEAYNLAPFVAKSEVLKYLLHLNVNLAKVEAKPNAASSLVKLNMERDVVPVMLFFKDLEIPDSKLGKVIGLHPYIFEEFDKAKLVVDFLKLKKFKKAAITKMITGAPPLLGLKVLTIDTRIGTYQKYFKLTGDEVRDVMTRVPRLILSHTNELKETIEMFRDYEFSKHQLKKIFLKCPSVFKSHKEDNLQHRLEYLMTNIPMDQQTIAEFSYILRYPSNPIKERHLFLLELGRAQYDPTKESYISPTDLVCTPESKFCQLARTTPEIFKEFKMTL